MKDIIRKKREGQSLSSEEIHFWIRGVVDGSIPDYQSSALLMAIFFRGMQVPERRELTLAMRDSGKPLQLSHFQRFVIDKHSSGGIGDKTSIILAPWLASCGALVPMISGRGLGFTGGTLDKLESIPGFSVELSRDSSLKALQEHGFFFAGQSEEIAPADKKLYALRDVTETVEEISLITASILSKKLSEDLNGLVLDIKCGTGAFMKTQSEAEELAYSLVETAKAAGVACRALITRMDFPLGKMVGNLCEIYEALEFMKPDSRYFHLFQQKWKSHLAKTQPVLQINSVEDNLILVTTALACEMLSLSHGLNRNDALNLLESKWASGELLEHFYRAVRFQGGDLEKLSASLQEMHELYETAVEFVSPQEGYLVSCHGQLLGELLVRLGAGRRVAKDTIEPLVGMEMLACEGKKLAKGEPICRIYKPGMSREESALCENFLGKAFVLGPEPPIWQDYIIKTVA
ncbi:MAG: thymidine phosphorylase [Leptospiraceae bacterium]|nr:thymidine phosphorylase [Leptospiraceae bacterium]